MLKNNIIHNFLFLLVLGQLADINIIVSKTTALSLNNLNKIERLIFGGRLANIQDKVSKDFKSQHDLKEKLIKDHASTMIASEKKLDVVIIFPGAGGPDQFTAELEQNIRRWDDNDSEILGDDAPGNAKFQQVTSRLVTTVDWSEHTGTLFTAAYNSEAVGDAVADTLWKSVHVRSVHCVGISVGAFAANAAARYFSHLSEKSHHVRLSLLDPFCSRGLWGGGYGRKNFGRYADYAEQYLNTDDPVPTTNDPLPLCACVDVTGSSDRDEFVLPENETYHCWPLVFYARNKDGYKKNLFFVDEEENGASERRIGLPIHGIKGVSQRGQVEQKY